MPKISKKEVKTMAKNQVTAEFIEKMRALRKVVAEMSDLYTENDWLNDEYDIQELVPMSLDDWVCKLDAFLDANP